MIEFDLRRRRKQPPAPFHQSPRTEVFGVFRVLHCRTQGDAGLTAKNALGNGVPEVFGQDVNGEEGESIIRIRPVTSFDRAGIAAAVKGIRAWSVAGVRLGGDEDRPHNRETQPLRRDLKPCTRANF